MSEKVVIDYFSDVLCVWAWIAQPRLQELEKQWPQQVTVNHHYFDVFGDAYDKIEKRWGPQEAFEKFCAHVHHSAGPFEASEVHPDLWRRVRPHSSAPAHLLLRAVALSSGPAKLAATALRIREAFFREAQDVGSMRLLLSLAEEQGVDGAALRASMEDGSALAAYSRDLKKAAELGIKGSPTWILNDGRQVLYGNVGYRILHANIEELLSHPEDEASWC